MAKLEEPQSIPSALLDLYRATLNPHPTGNIVKKRYPFRMPRMQEGGKGVHAGQVANRARFKKAVQDFKGVSTAERARWYAAEPPYSSFLWYYNYFIMSSLSGNANIDQGGAGVIKSIQVMKASCPVTGSHEFTLGTEVDADKTVVMLFGSGRKVPKVYRGNGSVAVGGSTLAIGSTIDPDKCTIKLNGATYTEITENSASPVSPYVSSLSSTQIGIAWSVTPPIAGTVSWEITEHVEGAVQPIIVSITNTKVDIDWSEAPDAAANVSILVIEYI